MGNTIAKKLIQLRCIPTLNAKNNLLYVQQVGYMPSEFATKIKQRQFSSYLLIVVIKGSGFFKYEGIEYRIYDGQCVFIDCKSDYSYRCDENNPWEVLWLNFNGNAAPFYYNLFLKNRCCVFLPQSMNDLTSIMYEIIATTVNKCGCTEIINSKLITDILTLIISNPCTHGPIENYQYQIKSIMEYIKHHFTENINLDELSSAFYLNKYYITREFKKEYGETIFQHIIKRRIDYAKDMLSSTDKTIDEISRICGFNDQSYFSKQFKKIVGISSQSYRKMNR